MSEPGWVARSTPILGAMLVVGGLGALVLALSRSDRGRRPEQGLTREVRGAPIRSGAAAKPPTVARPSEKPQDDEGADGEYRELTFATLSGYDYPKSGSDQVGAPMVASADAKIAGSSSGGELPPSKVPEAVRAFDGKSVEITGFMNPIEFDRDGVKSFALTAIPGGCCYGAIPRLNEWVVVEMPGDERAEYAYYDPVTIYGEISIGEQYEDGTVLSLYRMTPDKIDVGY